MQHHLGRRADDAARAVGDGGWPLAYSVTKAGFHRIADMLVVEYGDQGIRAFNVNPGFVATERVVAAGDQLEFVAKHGITPDVIGSRPSLDLIDDPAVRQRQLRASARHGPRPRPRAPSGRSCGVSLPAMELTKTYTTASLLRDRADDDKLGYRFEDAAWTLARGRARERGGRRCCAPFASPGRSTSACCSRTCPSTCSSPAARRSPGRRSSASTRPAAATSWPATSATPTAS